jgi:hypothetical protein
VRTSSAFILSIRSGAIMGCRAVVNMSSNRQVRFNTERLDTANARLGSFNRVAWMVTGDFAIGIGFWWGSCIVDQSSRCVVKFCPADLMTKSTAEVLRGPGFVGFIPGIHVECWASRRDPSGRPFALLRATLLSSLLGCTFILHRNPSYSEHTHLV